MRLYFAEIFWGGIGKRIFDVDAEGVKLLDDYDINGDVGPQTEVVKTFTVNVSDGELNLLFDAAGADGKDQPKVAAIEVKALATYPVITVDAIADQDNVVGDDIGSLGISATGGNPYSNFSYSISGQPEGIDIEPNNGLIYGTIGANAVIGGL